MANVGGCDAGLTDPLLAKQKQHSKKAFELIGKALRLDEENKHGMYANWCPDCDGCQVLCFC